MELEFSGRTFVRSGRTSSVQAARPSSDPPGGPAIDPEFLSHHSHRWEHDGYAETRNTSHSVLHLSHRKNGSRKPDLVLPIILPSATSECTMARRGTQLPSSLWRRPRPAQRPAGAKPLPRNGCGQKSALRTTASSSRRPIRFADSCCTAPACASTASGHFRIGT